MALSGRLQTLAAGILAATILLLDGSVQAQQNVPPGFGPPLQYTSKPGHEYDALFAANVSWLKSKLTDRKRRRREAQNSFRLEPAATKPQIQAVPLRPDEAVLGNCKTGSTSGPAQHRCTNPSSCSSPLS